ncbi:MAG: hypothetical protein NDI90_15610 [Nitrospira sp. BO4]|nr:hypothetical protein [Nitrospira sp. BO4]
MDVWWILSGLVSVVVGMGFIRQWQVRRHRQSKFRSGMTKPMDGETLQFLVRPTRKG